MNLKAQTKGEHRIWFDGITKLCMANPNFMIDGKGICNGHRRPFC